SGLDGLILQLLEKRPRDRLGYAADVAAALSAAGAEAAELDGPRPRTYLYRPELTGRPDAVATLVEAVDRITRHGGGGLVLVSGESGVGKTRIAMEAARLATERALTVITGRCAAPGAGEAGTKAALAPPLCPLRPLLLAVADRARRGREEADRLLGARGRV